MARLRYDTPPVPADHESPLGTPVHDSMPSSSGDVWHAGAPGELPPGRPQPPVVRPPGGGIPVNRNRPVVLGTTRVGSAITATAGVWDGDPTEFHYFALRDGVAFVDGVNPVYTLQPEDEGAMMSVRVWASNANGRGESTSAAVGPVLPAPIEPDPPPENLTRPVVTGSPEVGHALASSPGTWSNNPANYAYQWLRLPFLEEHELRDAGDIDGAVNPTYTCTTADIGQRLACRVTASNSEGEAESTSLPTLPVRGPDWNPPSWLVRDTAIHWFDPDRPKPLYGVPTPDPVFHSIVTRISGNVGTAIPAIPGANWGTVVRHPGFQRQAWNCDQSLIYISENSGDGAAGAAGLFLRGDLPYEPLFGRHANWPAGADVCWHPTDPELMDCARGNLYSHFNVRTGEDTPILNFGAGYTDLRIGQNQGNRSTDGKVIGFTVTTGGARVFVAYDIENDRRYPNVPVASVDPSSFTAARIAADGRGILWNFTGDNYFWTDLEGGNRHPVPGGSFGAGAMAQGDVGLNASGQSILVGRVNQSGAGAGASGTQSAWRLSDGQRQQLTNTGYLYTASLRAADVNYSGHARWAACDTRAIMSGGNLAAPPYTCENVLLPLEGGLPWRLCHNFNATAQDNPAWTSPSLSPDGQRCIFASVWIPDGSGGANPRPVSVYVCDYRSATMPPKPTPPVNTALPSISGTPVLGQQLICNNGTWTGANSFARRWRRDGDPILGATAAAYTCQDIDIGHMIDCQVVGLNATNGGYAFALAPAVGPITSPDEAPWEPPSWVITDRVTRDYNPARPKPDYMVPTPDPNYRSMVLRVSGDPGTSIPGIGGQWGQVCGPNYINHAAWNIDQSLLYILNSGGTSGSIWLDGETYQPRFARGSNWPSGADVRWHPFEPDLMDAARNNQFSYYNVRTNTNTIMHTFAGVSDLRIGHNKGNRSDDGAIVVLTAMRSGRQVAIVYDIQRDVVINEIDALTALPGRAFSSCWASPSGNYMIWNMSPDNYVITDTDGNIVFDFPTNYISHGDCCYDEVHDEVLAGRRNSSSLPGWTPNSPSGEIWKHRLRDGQRTHLTQGGWAPHTACRGQIPRNQVYCVAGTYDQRTGGQPTSPPYVGEIIMPRLDGTKVYRLCQHMGNNGPEYETFAFAVQSPDSKRVVYRSDWRAAGATPRPVQAYVVDIRE